jgi:UV DNA damage repair endonuclease
MYNRNMEDIFLHRIANQTEMIKKLFRILTYIKNSQTHLFRFSSYLLNTIQVLFDVPDDSL